MKPSALCNVSGTLSNACSTVQGAFHDVAAPGPNTPGAKEKGASYGDADQDGILTVDAREGGDAPKKVDGAADYGAGEDEETDHPPVTAIFGVDQVARDLPGSLDDEKAAEAFGELKARCGVGEQLVPATHQGVLKQTLLTEDPFFQRGLTVGIERPSRVVEGFADPVGAITGIHGEFIEAPNQQAGDDEHLQACQEAEEGDKEVVNGEREGEGKAACASADVEGEGDGEDDGEEEGRAGEEPQEHHRGQFRLPAFLDAVFVLYREARRRWMRSRGTCSWERGLTAPAAREYFEPHLVSEQKRRSRSRQQTRDIGFSRESQFSCRPALAAWRRKVGGHWRCVLSWTASAPFLQTNMSLGIRPFFPRLAVLSPATHRAFSSSVCRRPEFSLTLHPHFEARPRKVQSPNTPPLNLLQRTYMSEPEAKRVKMSNPVIGTHNGHFHADEALAVFLLRLLPQYRNASLIRTRDPEVLKTCTIVVDVGGVHDDSILRYDHHQREFNANFPGKDTKLSSAGLVWMHYGHRIINAVTGISEKDADCELLYQKIYEDFVEAFDANDNGISAYDPSAIRQAGIEKKFNDKGFSIASVVNRYNYAPSAREGADGPTANGTTTSGAPAPKKEKSQDEEDARFLRASAFVGEQFSLEIEDRAQSWLPARGVVKQAFAEREQWDPKGRIIVIPYKPEGVPWSDHLYALEAEKGCEGQVLYALFAENGEPDSKWRIRAVSLEPGSFENRKGLPEQWRGVRDEELSKVSGVPGCVFVHAKSGGYVNDVNCFKVGHELDYPEKTHSVKQQSEC
ncbi:metal-dependent protein hydrolase [Hortaea werneckii]|nr:metal-dependent protein hydrolase [Hortaea werneckii]